MSQGIVDKFVKPVQEDKTPSFLGYRVSAGGISVTVYCDYGVKPDLKLAIDFAEHVCPDLLWVRLFDGPFAGAMHFKSQGVWEKETPPTRREMILDAVGPDGLPVKAFKSRYIYGQSESTAKEISDDVCDLLSSGELSVIEGRYVVTSTDNDIRARLVSPRHYLPSF